MAFTDHLLLLEKKDTRLTQRFILIRHSKTRRIGITKLKFDSNLRATKRYQIIRISFAI
jgi:hypothetical protein